MVKTLEQGMSCQLERHAIRVDDHLRISFRRTIRVPDNHQVSSLPPYLDAFPLHPIARYADNLPTNMAAKGGAFLPMHRESRKSYVSEKTPPNVQ